MKKKFILLTAVHPNNIEGDTTIYVASNSILLFANATVLDKKHRSECNTMITFNSGHILGVAEKPAEILSMINEIVLD